MNLKSFKFLHSCVCFLITAIPMVMVVMLVRWWLKWGSTIWILDNPVTISCLDVILSHCRSWILYPVAQVILVRSGRRCWGVTLRRASFLETDTPNKNFKMFKSLKNIIFNTIDDYLSVSQEGSWWWWWWRWSIDVPFAVRGRSSSPDAGTDGFFIMVPCPWT